MKTLFEAEKICKETFACAKPFWFASSPGKDTSVIFKSDDDFVLGMNIIALAAHMHRGIRIICFVIMNNHFHFIIASESKEEIAEFFKSVKKKLGRCFPEIKKLELDIRPIDDLYSMRNHIAYTHRNGYVANPKCTPISYRWGTAPYFYNDTYINSNLSELDVRKRRMMFKGRDPDIPKNWGVINGYVAPDSYCDIKFGMSLFRDAHQYFVQISKNIESYSELSELFDNEEFLTDAELLEQVKEILRKNYRQATIRELSKPQKQDLARTLHFDFHSSNGQIRRVLGLSNYEIDSIFPLSSSHNQMG